MRFIPKKKLLTEAEVNPLDTNSPDLSHDEAYRQAILNAIASETAAYNEYDQILSLEDKVTTKTLVDLFHDTLSDIREEEMKHIAQLTTQISKVPELKAAYEDGKKEADSGEDTSDEKEENEKEDVKESVISTKKALTEAVTPNRMYEADLVVDIIANTWQVDDDDYLDLSNFFGDGELTAEEVDRKLSLLTKKYHISPEMLEKAEQAIVDSSDPVEARRLEFKDDINYDVSTLEEIKDRLYSVAAKNKVDEVISYLQTLEHPGEKDVGWRSEHSIIGGSNPTKKIIY